MDKWPHLGHIVSKDGDDRSDILNRRGSFIGQANNVVFWFGKLDCRVKIKLLKAYCSSFYGSELWDLGSENINAKCIPHGVKPYVGFGSCRTIAIGL